MKCTYTEEGFQVRGLEYQAGGEFKRAAFLIPQDHEKVYADVAASTDYLTLADFDDHFEDPAHDW